MKDVRSARMDYIIKCFEKAAKRDIKFDQFLKDIDFSFDTYWQLELREKKLEDALYEIKDIIRRILNE